MVPRVSVIPFLNSVLHVSQTGRQNSCGVKSLCRLSQFSSAPVDQLFGLLQTVVPAGDETNSCCMEQFACLPHRVSAGDV